MAQQHLRTSQRGHQGPGWAVTDGKGRTAGGGVAPSLWSAPAPDLLASCPPHNESILPSMCLVGRRAAGTRETGGTYRSQSDRKGCRRCQDVSPQISSDNSHGALPGPGPCHISHLTRLPCSCSHRPPKPPFPPSVTSPGTVSQPPLLPSKPGLRSDALRREQGPGGVLPSTASELRPMGVGWGGWGRSHLEEQGYRNGCSSFT